MDWLRVFFNWTRTYTITINGFSFSWLDVWLWCMLAGIIINFIVKYFNGD